MKTISVPVEVSLVRTPDGHDRIVSKISLGHLMSDTPAMADADHKLSLFTEEYLTTLSKCKEELRHIEEEKRKRGGVNPIHFWRVGDSLLAYLDGQPHQDVFVLRDPYGHFARDLSVSKSTLQKAVTFRRRFNSPETIDTTKGWDYYREAKYLRDGKPGLVAKTTQRETREITVSIRFAVPVDANAQWLGMQLKRWLYGTDDSAVSPRWLEEKGLKIKNYEVSIPINELQPRDEKQTPSKSEAPWDEVAERHSG
jgi:hypothetical protein